MAGQSRRQDAVKHVYTQCHGLQEGHRVPDTHEVPGPVDRQFAQGGGQSGQHLLSGFADGQAADAVAVELQGGQLGGLFRPEVGGHAALDDAEQALVAAPVGVASPARPGQGALGRQPDVLLGGREAAADVEGHLNVGPQAFLHPHGEFRGQALKRSVIGGAEGHAVVICPRCRAKRPEIRRSR